jgi:hypothetical protein
VLSWYSGSLNLILPMDFLVLSGLPFAGPVAASLQPYIRGQKQDLFEDFSDDELLGLLETNDRVREQFIFFAKQTIRQWDEGKMCFDFLGRENLILVNQGGNYRLRLVDVGSSDSMLLQKNSLRKWPKLSNAWIDWLLSTNWQGKISRACKEFISLLERE